MAEEIKQSEEKKKKPEREKSKKPERKEEIKFESLIRILATDIPGDATIYAGLTRIKGVSWSLSNAICHVLKLDKERKVKSLSEVELQTINNFIKNPQVPEWLLNRKKDPATGLSKHLVTAELEMQKEFDIRKMKKIRTYKGWRHAIGQPVRGQRTRSHFRKGVSVGVIKKKEAPGKSEKSKEEKKK
jgi:small subunit ribosomal protein S13